MNTESEILAQTDTLLHQVIDPEIGINIVDLGLVYQLELTEEKEITVTMTMTTPGCPMSQTITANVIKLLEKMLPGYTVKVNLVWYPMWEPDMITEEGQRQLDGKMFEPPEQEKPRSIWGNLFS